MIRSNGGIFGRNPAFNNVLVQGTLEVDGGISTFYQGAALYPPVTFDDGNNAAGLFLRAADSTGYLQWSGIAFAVDTQVFTSSGTWTKPANAIVVVVEMCGGGGGGGTGTASAGGNGGSAGTYIQQTFAAADLTATVSVTCGAGGTSGGGIGGESLFGAHTTEANSYLRTPGGLGASTQIRTQFGGVGSNSFGTGGAGATTTTTAGNPGRYGGYGPGGGGGGGRGAAGGAGGKSSVNAWSAATTTQTGGGAAGGASGSAGTNASTFNSRTNFGDGGGGGGNAGAGGNGIRGSGGGGSGASDLIGGGAGGAGVVVVRTARFL